ncbi:MAG: hypothetical protein ACREBU_18030 [Nitrososphaera sp.]
MELHGSIQDFLTWLIGRLDAQASQKYECFEFFPPDNADWFMDVPSDLSKPVRFNTHALHKCSYEYYRMIVLHECFHLFVQDVPNKLDAKRLKDDFGDTMMVLLDVEADFYTYLFHRQILRYRLIDVLGLNYEGASVFGDKTIRVVKFERFIGSNLSIINNYLNGGTTETDIFLVSTNNIPTEDSIHILVHKNTHVLQRQVKIDRDDMDALQKLYGRSEGVSKEKYVRGIIRFCSKALGFEMPGYMQDELALLTEAG